MDIKLSPLMPEWRRVSSPHEPFFKQISSSVASWFATMRGLIPVDINDSEPNILPERSSPWDRLMASSPPQSHSLAASRFSYQKGALISSLLESAPRFGKYYHVRCASVHGHPQRSVGYTDTQPSYILSRAIPTLQPPSIAITPTSVIPTIVVTDFDGPLLCDINDNCQDQMYRAMTCGKGLLWSQWRGKFSPSQCRSRIEAGDEIYIEDDEGCVEEAEVDSEDYFEDYKGITTNASGKVGVATLASEEPKSIIQEVKELEWWEIEEGDDETRSSDGSEDESEDESDSDFDEDFDEDDEDRAFSDSEDGDDEYADDSDDDDSGEDSDLGESEDNETILAIGNPPVGVAPSPPQKPNSNTAIHAYTKNFDRNTQDSDGLSPSLPPASTQPDIESYNSRTAILPHPASPPSTIYASSETKGGVRRPIASLNYGGRQSGNYSIEVLGQAQLRGVNGFDLLQSQKLADKASREEDWSHVT